MAGYKRIKFKEYKKGLGNIGVFGNNVNTFAKDLCNKATEKFKVVVFNLRDLECNYKNEFIYYDNSKRTGIEYVKNKCYELKKTFKDFTIIIDFENIVPYTKDDLYQLKKLSQILETYIIITTNLLDSAKTKKYPRLEDLGNKALIDVADKIMLSNNKKWKKPVLAKNNFGKTGILV